MKKTLVRWLPFLLFFLALAFRLYRLSATQIFLEDEGRDLLMVKYMVDTKRPVLLGPQTSTGNMYLGPFYYYFIAPALLFAHFNPIGPAILIALTGALTVFLFYRFLSSRFGWKTGLIASLLYAVMPLPVMFTRNSWNPNLVPLISLLIIWVVDKILFESNNFKNLNRLFLILGALVGILIQLHYMALIILPFLALVLIFKLGKKLPLTSYLSLLTFTLLTFTITLSPFIVFEFRHQFVNTKAIVRFIQAKQEHNIRYNLPLWLWKDKVFKTSTQLIDGLLGRGAFQAVDPWSKQITLSFFLLLFLSPFFYKSKIKNKRRIFFLIGILLFSLSTLGIYQENIHLHYLAFLFPLVYIILAIIATQTKPIISFLVTGYWLLVTGYSLPTTFNYINSGPSYQVEKARAVAKFIAKDSGHQPYNVVSRSDTNTTPYQYFLAISSHPPVNQLANTLYLICQDRSCTQSDVNLSNLFVRGPAHPYLKKYVGHPVVLNFQGRGKILFTKHISHGIWVAKIRVKK